MTHPLARPSICVCPCGLPRKQGCVLCLPCWEAAPADAKRRLRSRTLPLEDKWAAARELKAFARSRRQPELLTA